MRKHLFSLITALLCLGSLMTVQADTWTPAGTPASVFTNEWTPNTPANDMTLSNGLYVFSKSVNFSSNTSIQFKVCKNHDWSVAYPSSDYYFTIPSGAKYLIITYNTSGNVVDACAISTMTVAGSNTTLFGTSWAPSNTANDMTLDGGVYKFEKEHVTLSAGTIEFKAVSNHDWGHEWPSSNYQLSIPESGEYTVTITFDPATLAVNATATLEQAVVVIPTVQLHSNIKNADWESADFTTDEGDETASLQLTDVDAGNYAFGIKIDGNWTSNSSAFTRTDNSKEIVSGSGDCSFTADIPGNYTFTWRYADNTLSIGYPDLVEYVEGLIAAIGEVTLESASAINAARTAYDDLLSDAQQAQVSNYSVLTDAEAAYETLINQIAANAVKDLIDDIPNPVVYNAACHNAILAARNGYEGLSEVQKGMVSNYSVLTAAEVAYAELTPYTVAGSSDVAFVNTWDPAFADNDMVKINGIYTWEKTNLTLPVGIIEFKVCEGHSWDVAYPGNNYVLNIETSGIYTITITYNPEGNVVSAVATLIQAEVVIPTVAMHGTFTGNWADTELFEKSSTDDYCSLKLNLEAATYNFGMRIGGSGDWTANGVQFTRTNASAVVEAGGADLSIVADYAGEYTFTWTYADHTLTVTYPARPVDANFEIDFRAVINTDELPESVELIDGTFNDGQHGYRLPVLSIYVTAGNYLVKMGACQYSNQDGAIKNEDGTVTYATLATNTGVCYHQNPAANYVAAIITVPSDQVIKVYGAEYTPYFSIAKMAAAPDFEDFIIGFNMTDYYVYDNLPVGTSVAGTFHDTQHGYEDVVLTIPLKAGKYRLTLGGCKFGTGAGRVISETNTILAEFDQNIGVCFDPNNMFENVVTVVFDVDIDQHITIDCGQYTPFMRLENITNVAPEPVFATDKDFEIDLRNGQLGTSNSDPTTKYLAIDGENYTYTDAAAADYVAILSAANYNGSQHGYMNLDVTLHLEAGDYRVTLGACQYGTGTGAVKNENMSATIVAFNQNLGENKCYHQNEAENIVPVEFHLDAEQTVHVVCGNYTPYIKFENTTAPEPEEQNITPKVDPQHDGLYYSTFYDSQVSYELPAGVEAYVATISGSDLLLTKIAEGGQVIPADNAVILKSTVSPYTLTPSDAAAVSVSANSLQGTDVAMATPAHCYVLSGADGVVGFYPYGAEYLNPHKAYVIYSAQSNAPRHMRFIFDTATDITNVQGNVQNTKVLRNGQLIIIKNGVEYNVSGQKVK